MRFLDACTSFCTALSETIGPTLTELLLGGVVLALAWWKNRKNLAAVLQRAVVAEEKADQAQQQIAAIHSSLRPVAPVAQQLGTSSSSSGNFERVVMPELGDDVPKPHPSFPAIDEDAATDFPPAPRVPSLRDTPLERPRGKP